MNIYIEKTSAMDKFSSKDVMLPHSRAKVNFYKTYLDLYLRILCNSKYIDVINIYDVFCGMGIYKDGGKGSPIEAYDVIRRILTEFSTTTQVYLHVNDKDCKKINAVKHYIQERYPCSLQNFTPQYNNIDSEKLLEDLSNTLASTPSRTRNLIFIDPYGYKEIKKDVIEKLMMNGKTEIIIFLPISFMNRFTKYALDNEDVVMYKPLRDFVKSFFPPNHPIVRGDQMSHMDYIAHLTHALRFNKYHSTSYHIERSQNNYFALFFITSNLAGFEKILETKWKLDENDGHGFHLPRQQTLFDEIEKKEHREMIFKKLYDLTVACLKEGEKTNHQLYLFALSNEYLPKHMGAVLLRLQQEGQLVISHIPNTRPIIPNAFYLSRNEGNRITIKLKK